MTCSSRMAQRHTRPYTTVHGSPSEAYSERTHWDDIAYCGSQFQVPLQRNSHVHRNPKRQKTSMSRQHTTLSIAVYDTRPTANGPSTTGSRKTCTSSIPLQSTHQNSARTIEYPSFPSIEPVSLPSRVPSLTHASDITLAKLHHHLPPETHCYQLNRFLDEGPDFRTATYSKHEVPLHEARTERTERSKKNYNALRVSMGSLQGSIEH